MLSTVDVVLRLLLATLAGGIIGMERERIRRAAGFRTHILVCCGSSLVMLISLFLFEAYGAYANIDPGRLGAQVISGIGFLGAGTIIKDGSTIKGLTTAASLWAVSCIGLALGSGFYVGGLTATVLVLIALKFFSGFERFKVADRKRLFSLEVLIDNNPGQIGKVAEVLGEQGILIIEITLEVDSEDSEHGILYLTCKGKSSFNKEDLITVLGNVEGVIKTKLV